MALRLDWALDSGFLTASKDANAWGPEPGGTAAPGLPNTRQVRQAETEIRSVAPPSARPPPTGRCWIRRIVPRSSAGRSYQRSRPIVSTLEKHAGMAHNDPVRQSRTERYPLERLFSTALYSIQQRRQIGVLFFSSIMHRRPGKL